MIAVVNKMDRMGADFEAATKSLSVRCDLTPIKVQAPLVEKDVFEGPRDLIGERDAVLAEAVADVDDAFAELYIEDAFTAEDLIDAVARLTKSRDITPCSAPRPSRALGSKGSWTRSRRSCRRRAISGRGGRLRGVDLQGVARCEKRSSMLRALLRRLSITKNNGECGVSIITARGPFEVLSGPSSS